MTKYAENLCKLIEEKSYKMAFFDGELKRLCEALKQVSCDEEYENEMEKLKDIVSRGVNAGIESFEKEMAKIKKFEEKMLEVFKEKEYERNVLEGEFECICEVLDRVMEFGVDSELNKTGQICMDGQSEGRKNMEDFVALLERKYGGK